MPPEPLPWERKDFFKERKHERSDSIGSVARWRDSSHHGQRELNRWGSGDFRRPPGRGKQGGWHVFYEESGNGYGPPRSSTDKVLEDENCRPSLMRGYGKYERNGRERGSFNQRDWRGHSMDPINGSLNMPGRPQHDVNNSQRSVDDMLMHSSNSHSDFVNTWDRNHQKEQHDMTSGVNGLSTGQRCDKESTLNSIDWKPLKWTRSGSLSSRGSGFNHSGSSKGIGALETNETKLELPPKNATPIQSPSGDAATYMMSSLPYGDTNSRKKPRLGWGEGLAKYEKKKVDGPDVSLNKDGATFSNGSAELAHSLGSSLVDKSPRVTGFSDCASPATPSSVACSSSSGVEEKLFGKTASIDNDVSKLSGSPGPGSFNHLEALSFNLEKLDVSSLANLGSLFSDMLQPDDPVSLDSSFVRSNVMNKLLICKSEISKTLEVTESEIDSLENEFKCLRSENEGSCPRPAASSALPVDDSVQCFNKQGNVSLLSSRPALVRIASSGDTFVERMPICNGDLEDVNSDAKDDDIDSPGTATSKYMEQPSLLKEVSTSSTVKIVCRSGNFNAVQSPKVEEKSVLSTSNGEENETASGGGTTLVGSEAITSIFGNKNVSFSAEKTFCDLIWASNKKSACSASEVFNNLLRRDEEGVDVWIRSKVACPPTDPLIKEKFSVRKNSLKFKERVLTLKFKAFKQLWKEDLTSLSIRKSRAKPQKKFDLSLRVTHNGHQKYRTSIRSRFTSSAGNLGPVMTTEIINYAGKLLSDSRIKLYRDTLKMPALILDKKEKTASRFISSNGLVEDPFAVEKERVIINPWTSEEREIFMEKLAVCGKNFRRIASFLDHKTTADCVEFYYKNHKSDSFEKTKKKTEFSKQVRSYNSTYLVTSGKKWNCESNAASLDLLGAASAMAAHADESNRYRQRGYGRLVLRGNSDSSKASCRDDSISERTSSCDVLGNERETVVAADVLAGICGCLPSEAMSSCITSSVDPEIKWHLIPDVIAEDVDDETCSDESCGEMDPSDWTDEEKSRFIQAVSTYGKDFAMISRCVRTRSRDQCKIFFSKTRKCLGLDSIQPRGNVGGEPVSGDDRNSGGRSDTEDACVLATGCPMDDDKDLPESVVKKSSKESDPVGALNLQSTTELRSGENMVCDLVSMKSEIDQGYEDQSELVSSEKCTIFPVKSETGEDQAIELGNLVTESLSVGDAIQQCLSDSDAIGENQALPKASSFENLRSEEKISRGDSGAQSDMVNNTGGGSSGFNLNTEIEHQVTLEEIPLNCSTTTVASSLIQESGLAKCGEKMLNQDCSSSTIGFQESRDVACHEPCAKREHYDELLSRHSESLQILNGYPVRQKDIIMATGKVGSSNYNTAQDFSLRKCITNSKPCCPASELPLLSLKGEEVPNHSRPRSKSFSDSDRPSTNGDVKLFGQILSNPASKSNSGSNENEENETRFHKGSGKSNLACLHHSADGNSAVIQFDRSNLGVWDGCSAIQTGFSSLPDSAILLARYPAAFGSYSSTLPPSRVVDTPLGPTRNEQNLNGISVLPTRDLTSSRSSREKTKAESFPVGMKKQHQDIFAEMQRRRTNGFGAISSLQNQDRGGVIGMNVMGSRGIFVGGSGGGPCTGVSDPVAAIKLHYAKAKAKGEQYGGGGGGQSNNGGIIREEGSWHGGKDDNLGR